MWIRPATALGAHHDMRTNRHSKSGSMRSALDLLAALMLHLGTVPLWLILTVGVGQSIPLSESAATIWRVGAWLLVAALPATWVVLAVMLVVWWRKGCGPVWSYPLRWTVALFFTFLSLVALSSRKVRRMLAPAAPPQQPA